MRYSLFGYIFRTKTTLGILNISLRISIAYLSIDILKFSICHLHYTMHVWKNYWMKKMFQVSSGTRICASPEWTLNSCCATTYTKSQNLYNESITGHKKLKKLDNVKIGNLKRKYRDCKKVLKQDEDAGNLQILLHLRSLFWLLLFKNS